MNKPEILEINNEQDTLSKLDEFIKGLDSGIQAISLDFNYHIKNTFFNDKIFDLRNNISYRLSSSRFHFHLLFKEFKEIQQKHQVLDYSSKNIQNSPTWHIEMDKRHLSYIIDSIVFHLSSVFDYTAILVNYVTSITDNKPSWNSLEKSARNNSNIFSKDITAEVRETIKEVHNYFVGPLYDYRSNLIHRTADLIKGNYIWEIMSDTKTLLFLCSKLQHKSFKNIANKNVEISIIYFAQYLLFTTIESIAKILKSLRQYIVDNSNAEKHIQQENIMFFYVDEKTKEIKSPGMPYWEPFDSIFSG